MSYRVHRLTSWGVLPSAILAAVALAAAFVVAAWSPAAHAQGGSLDLPVRVEPTPTCDELKALCDHGDTDSCTAVQAMCKGKGKKQRKGNIELDVPKPDLIVYRITPRSAQTGEPYPRGTFEVNLMNVTPGTCASFSIKLRMKAFRSNRTWAFARNPSQNANEFVYSSETVSPYTPLCLPRGADPTEGGVVLVGSALSFQLPSPWQQFDYVEATVDPERTIDEADESNNTLRYTIPESRGNFVLSLAADSPREPIVTDSTNIVVGKWTVRAPSNAPFKLRGICFDLNAQQLDPPPPRLLLRDFQIYAGNEKIFEEGAAGAIMRPYYGFPPGAPPYSAQYFDGRCDYSPFIGGREITIPRDRSVSITLRASTGLVSSYEVLESAKFTPVLGVSAGRAQEIVSSPRRIVIPQLSLSAINSATEIPYHPDIVQDVMQFQARAENDQVYIHSVDIAVVDRPAHLGVDFAVFSNEGEQWSEFTQRQTINTHRLGRPRELLTIPSGTSKTFTVKARPLGRNTGGGNIPRPGATFHLQLRDVSALGPSLGGSMARGVHARIVDPNGPNLVVTYAPTAGTVGPNLRVARVVIDWRGGALRIRALIENIGDVVATESVASATVIDADGEALTVPDEESVRPFHANSGTTVEWSDGPVTVEGASAIEVCADINGDVEETDEEDNCDRAVIPPARAASSRSPAVAGYRTTRPPTPFDALQALWSFILP